MINEPPITPPPELVQQWMSEIWHEGTPVRVALSDEHIATRAAQYGLKISLDWLLLNGYGAAASRLSAALRPKPPTLKDQALALINRRIGDGYVQMLTGADAETIRRALEALDD